MKKLGDICNKQHGFTLVELLIAASLVVLIGTAIAMGTHQIFSGSMLSIERMTVLNNLRNAGDWISRDARMAENSITINENCPTMNWTYYNPLTGEDPDQMTAVYTLSDGNLYRHYEKWSSGDPPVLQETLDNLIAENININDITFNANSFSITLTVMVGSVSETRTFSTSLRDLPQ